MTSGISDLPLPAPVHEAASVAAIDDAAQATRQRAGRAYARWIRWARALAWILLGLSSASCTTLVAWELHTSGFQSHWLSGVAAGLTWSVHDGASHTPLQAPQGPYDIRHGYALLPEIQERLVDAGYRVVSQAQPSHSLGSLAERGVYPPYDEKHEPALVIVDPHGNTLYDARPDEQLFRDFIDIPPVIVQSLLFVENRALLDPRRPHLNPALEWDRLVLSSWRFALDRVFGTGNLSGGSTLATQIQKFRHSPGGRTHGLRDKAVQMVTASLRAYRDGRDTRRARQRIVVDYLNGLPLGAAPGVGEVRGMGRGLEVWFGKSLERLVVDLSRPEVGEQLLAKGQSFKEALALILATRRPGLYLASDTALDERLEFYLRQLARRGIISWELAAAAHRAPLQIRAPGGDVTPPHFVDAKAANAVRTRLLGLLPVDGLFDLDRLDVRVASTLDVPAQTTVRRMLQKLTDPVFLRERGFIGPHLLEAQGATDVVYTFSLYESSPGGNRLLVQADNFDRPLDLNEDTKIELGSTAKLRTLANYLGIVAALHAEHHDASRRDLRAVQQGALDPIKRWTLGWMRAHPAAGLEPLLWAAVERKLSADPGKFFTGGGVHDFENFDWRFSGDVSLRTAFQHSNNLVFVRLMREIVQYYTADLGYDEEGLLARLDHEGRRELLEAAAERETRQHLARAWRHYAKEAPGDAVRELCGSDADALRRFAIFHLGSHARASLDELIKAARAVYPERAAHIAASMPRHHMAYGGRNFSLADEAWLMKREPLDIWFVRDRHAHPDAAWIDVLERSTEARRTSYAWLFRPSATRAQKLRIRTELERRAFVPIHAAWRELGYPFASLVPSLATAIGSSADRPSALAELVGIIQNEGIRAPTLRIAGLHFAEHTPYETHFSPAPAASKRVMPVEVARVLKQLMVEVVEGGTAERVHGALATRGGEVLTIGGKTGSGDNRVARVDRRGNLLSSRAVNRTASFVFLIGESHYGVVTAQVLDETAAEHSFTSALALQAFNELAPTIAELVGAPEQRAQAAADAVAKPQQRGEAVPASAAPPR